MNTLPQTVRWIGDRTGELELVDQTRLPVDIHLVRCRSVEQVWEAIRSLRVRGAPAIGIAAAYGIVLGMQEADSLSSSAFFQKLDSVCKYLADSRPTAVNLFWAIERLRRSVLTKSELPNCVLHELLLAESIAIHEEDRQMCRAIGRHGAQLLNDGDFVLTHCNAGGLATSEYGTALAIIFAAVEAGKRIHVWVDETRPLLQGARLTAWELQQRDIDCTLLCDSMAGQLMSSGRVNAVITGADRIASNGDTANKIGTYGLAVLAKAHGVPFYVAAPSSTFDLAIRSGAEIPIEHRAPEELTQWNGQQIAPLGIKVYNPAFDVTPHSLIRAIVTERGVLALNQSGIITTKSGSNGVSTEL